ncbi:hypothetical protein DFR50_10811 [Roseiarcus fermentans]|uniref:Sugar O-methyltransferase n=1 Tax=Roseiarcus fermentans TaxID=1473586 RepID=A0A366FP06_9HYPH|nr:hypothetical protein [Roseiarcus fermentans]RBP15455.1 hypothetical protein DFR50_10811 [Roseiarcus fermentans]
MAIFARKAPPQYRGYLDRIEDGRLTGWADDRLAPKQRLVVEIFAAGAPLGAVRAELFRDDLAHAGVGDGRHGFSFAMPEGGTAVETLAARVAGSDFWLRSTLSRPSAAMINAPRRGLALLEGGFSARTAGDDDVGVAAELIEAWRRLKPRASLDPKTMWGGIVRTRHRALADLLAGDDAGALAACLVDIQKRPESRGLMQGDEAWADLVAASPEGRRAALAPFHDMLASLAQYLGVFRADCDELDFEGEALAVGQAALVAAIDAKVGFSIAPPTVFDGLFGLAIGDRIVHARDIQSLYAALRTIESSGLPSPRVCEIGGGFGKAACYAHRLGVKRYVVVDLPTVSAMQYFTLRRCLPDVRVTLRSPGERLGEDDGIDLVLAPQPGEAVAIRADIALNCDSFPEMGDAVCADYFARLPQWAPLLLSINQEAARPVRGPSNRQSVVSALLPQHGFSRRYRFRNWIRRGYVEELWAHG